MNITTEPTINLHLILTGDCSATNAPRRTSRFSTNKPAPTALNASHCSTAGGGSNSRITGNECFSCRLS
jgi:hypothetical protein